MTKWLHNAVSLVTVAPVLRVPGVLSTGDSGHSMPIPSEAHPVRPTKAPESKKHTIQIRQIKQLL